MQRLSDQSGCYIRSLTPDVASLFVDGKCLYNKKMEVGKWYYHNGSEIIGPFDSEDEGTKHWLKFLERLRR
jgi:hypothetical protein